MFAAQSALLKAFLVISVWILMLIFMITLHNTGYDRVLQDNKVSSPEYEKLQHFTDTEQEREQAHILSKEPNGTDEDLSPLESDVYDIPHELMRQENASGSRKYPTIHKHDFHNTQWQTYENINITFKLFGAYYDKRVSVPEGTVVRILAMINQIDKKFPINYCRLWFDEEPRDVLAPIIGYNLIWFRVWAQSDTVFYPYLLTCKIPEVEKSIIPKSISLVSVPEERASNNLTVIYEPPANTSKAEFAICVKGLNFTDVDISKRLVEWLQLNRILGAEKVFIYTLSINENIEKVLNFYAEQGFVEIHPFTQVIPENSRLNKRLNEVIPCNDCFYRNMYKYEYIVNVDVDEVIMPRGNLTSWHDLAKKAQQMQLQRSESCPHGFAGICFRNVYFPNFSDESTLAQPPVHSPSSPSSSPSSSFSSHFANSNFYMLQHMQKLADFGRPKEEATKCFHQTAQALTLHNHFALTWLKSCRPATMSTQFAHLQHYRTLETMQSHRTLVEDRSIWRFREQLVRSAVRVWRELGLP